MRNLAVGVRGVRADRTARATSMFVELVSGGSPPNLSPAEPRRNLRCGSPIKRTVLLQETVMSGLNRREFATTIAAAAVIPSFTRRFMLQAPAINPPSASALAELPRWMEMGGTPGLSMGVVQNGKLVWERYEGMTDAASKTPVSKESLFPAASLGKPVAALGARV